MLDVIDPQRIYRELSDLAGFYLEGQDPDYLLFRIRIAVTNLRTILSADPILTEARCSLSDFVRHAAALYHLDDPAGLQDPSFFSPYLAEELDRLIERFRPVPAVQEPQAVHVSTATAKTTTHSGPVPRPPSKEALALAVLADHPDWTDTKIAEAAGCKRTTLYTFNKFLAAKEILREGKNNLPRGSNFPDEPLEAWRDEGDG
jgi:hypothetical protein